MKTESSINSVSQPIPGSLGCTLSWRGEKGGQGGREHSRKETCCLGFPGERKCNCQHNQPRGQEENGRISALSKKKTKKGAPETKLKADDGSNLNQDRKEGRPSGTAQRGIFEKGKRLLWGGDMASVPPITLVNSQHDNPEVKGKNFDERDGEARKRGEKRNTTTPRLPP